MNWTSKQKISKLPNHISKHFLNMASFLYFDLQKNKLKIKTRELENPQIHSNQKERIVESQNPYWYSKFYWENTPYTLRKYKNTFKKRRIKTQKSIDRRLFENSLLKISLNNDKNLLKYDTLSRELIKTYLIEGIPYDEKKIQNPFDIFDIIEYEPENEIRIFFNLEPIETLKSEKEYYIKKYKEFGEEIFYEELAFRTGIIKEKTTLKKLNKKNTLEKTISENSNPFLDKNINPKNNFLKDIEIPF